MNTKRLFAASYGHLSIDIVNSSVAMILVVVAGQFNLSISKIGFGALVYQFSAAMSQPLFGGLTDKLNGRWIGAVGVAWTAIFYAAAAFMPNYPLFITLLMIGGLGSGAFHAAGMVNASGGHKAATATSYFFLGGQVGLALGPILAGVVIGSIGLIGMPLLALLAVPAAA
jgi:FSR family fosmidomycin resistance protein-like MFS transporter